jgi:hypothetical protein
VSRLPEAGARVGVKVHEWNAYLASTLEEVGAGVAAIAVPSDGRCDHDLPRGIALDLEWVTLRGLMRVRATAAGPRPDGAPGVLLALSGEPRLFERRDYVRANAAVDVRATLPGAPRDPVDGLTIDLSGGGCLAALPALRLEVDDRLALELRLPGEAPVGVDARVIRALGEDVFSLAFEAVRAHDQERLIRFVFAKLRGAAGRAA